MGERDEHHLHRQQHDLYQHQRLAQPPAIYGYPVDPQWGAHPMMHPQHMQGFPHPMHHHMDGVPLPPGIPGLGASTDPLEAVLGPFPCARLKNLPFDALLEDILILFQGLVVIDVLLLGSGEAFVIFANPMDFQMALQRDRQTIGRSFVEIYQGSRTEYYEAIANQQWQEHQKQPQLATGTDAGDASKQADAVVWGGVVMPTPAPPPPPIQALSAPKQHGEGVAAGKPRHSGGGPLVAAIASSKGSTAGRGGGSTVGQQVKRTGGGIQVGEHTGFLRMRGLPFSATKDDIHKFFENYHPILDSIVLTYRSDGRATGEAYVGFESPDDSKRAMDLHRKTIGTRYIELFLSNKEEHGRALARFGNR